MKKLNLTQQKHAFTNQKKCTTTQNVHKKPSTVAFYNIGPGNVKKKKDNWGSIQYRRTNNTYRAEIKNRIKGALSPGARMGHFHPIQGSLPSVL